MTQSGTLYVVGTPIGNVEDITLRALRLLSEAEVIVCEDTRVTNKLLEQLEQFRSSSTHHSLFRLDENVQMRMIPKVINWLETGTSVVLVTDAGMPTMSDPGWPVVAAIRDAGYQVEVIPGPTALTTALATAGMDSSRVWFVGFLPKKPGKRQEVYAEMTRQLHDGISTSVVFYEAPNRVKETLRELTGFKGQGPALKAAACGELTKQHEKVIRGTIEEVLAKLPVEVRGEWVIVVGR